MTLRIALLLVTLAAAACNGDATGSDNDDGPAINARVENANGIFFPASCDAPLNSIALLGHLDLPERLTDLWGYHDAGTGREYALAGFQTGADTGGLYVIDVTDPANPTLAATLEDAKAQDVVTWMNYAYTVTGAAVEGHTGIVYDLSDPTNPAAVGTFASAHNLFVSDRGYLYRARPGVQAYDLVPDPAAPEPIWQDGQTGVHDVAVIGDLLLDFHGSDGTFLYDNSNPFDPVRTGFLDDSSVRFHHSGWLSGDGAFLYINDELPANLNQNADISIWDVEAGVRVGTFRDTTSTVHNSYALCDRLVVSYYAKGLALFDISDPTELTLLDEFDTDPDAEGEGLFLGAWGVFPYMRSGNVLVSDVDKGLYVFRLE